MKSKIYTVKKLYQNLIFLKGPFGWISSAREWYQWIGLSKDMPRYRFLTFKFLSWIFKKKFKILIRLLPTSTKSILLPTAWEVGT